MWIVIWQCGGVTGYVGPFDDEDAARHWATRERILDGELLSRTCPKTMYRPIPLEAP